MSWPRHRVLLIALFAAAYAGYLSWFHSPYPSSSDAFGYMESARMLLTGRFSAPLLVPDGLTADVLPRQHLAPMAYELSRDGQILVPSYPVGLPLHFAAVGVVTGLGPATAVIGVGSALAFALLLYLTCREFGLGTDWSLGTTLLGALSPLVQFYALHPMSDLVAAVWALAVVLCALRSSRGTGWAAAAGWALAVAVLVRPTNALLFIPAAIALQPTLRTWAAFLLSGVPGAVFLAIYNRSLYGAVVTTGYGDMTHLFSIHHVPASVLHYARWIPVVATPLVLAAVALPWVRIDHRKKAVLVAWAVPCLAIYATYQCTQETWWYMRFILPALPALAIAAALALQQVSFPSWHLTSRLLPAGTAPDQLSRGRSVCIPLALLVGLFAAWWQIDWAGRLRVAKIELDDRPVLLAGRWLAEHLPADAVLVAHQLSSAAYHYAGQPVIDPNLTSPQDAARLDLWLRQNHRTLYAALCPFEEELVRRKLPGRWELVERIRFASIWRRVDPPPPAAILP